MHTMANELSSDRTTTMSEPGESREFESLLPANSRIKLIGVGGIGCVVLEYLTVYLNSLAKPLRLVLVDGDSFEPATVSRMSFASFGNKAQVKAAEAVQRLGQTSLTVAWRGDYVSEDNVADIVKENDLVLMCVDNFVSRRVVSDHCQQLDNVALFSAGNDGMSLPEQRGTYGNVQVHVRQGGVDRTVPITRYHPEIAKATQGHPNQVGCGELVKSVPQILFTNLAVGSSLLNAFLAYTLGYLEYQEVKLDILDARCLPQFPLAAPIGPVVK
jgi:hypothetical protein